MKFNSQEQRQLAGISLLFRDFAAKAYVLSPRGWQLKDKPDTPPFQLSHDEVARHLPKADQDQHFPTWHETYHPTRAHIGYFRSLLEKADSEHAYTAFRMLAHGSTSVVIEGETNNGTRHALRFGQKIQDENWRIPFPLMVSATHGTYQEKQARGTYILEVMPTLLVVDQHRDLKALVEFAFEINGPGWKALTALFANTPYSMMKPERDMALMPDGTIAYFDPENIWAYDTPLSAHHLRMAMMRNAGEMNYFPPFLELYTPDGRTKQDLFFPTGNPRNPRP